MDGMPKITEIQRETRRQQILAAALRCFSRDGFHNTTTADIVREAGLSQGTLYLYFGSKDDIVLALADDRRQAEAYVSALAESEEDPIKGLSLLLDFHGQSLTDRSWDDLRRVGVQGWAEALRNPTVKKRVAERMALVRQAIIRLVKRAQAAGKIRPGADPRAVAQMLMATFQGLILQASLGEKIDLTGVGRLMHEMLRNTLLTRAALAADVEDEPD
jgi:AcrR family transcriptional regulator